MRTLSINIVMRTLLAALSRAAGIGGREFATERRLMRQCVMMCTDGREALATCGYEARMADVSLREINAACVSPHAMMRCVGGYIDFCSHSQNLDTVAVQTERLLRRMMFVDWQHESAIDELEERLRRNLSGAVSYVFRGAGELWDDVKLSMRQLMEMVAALICRLRRAAMYTAEATDSDLDGWTNHYHTALAEAVEAERHDFELNMRLLMRRKTAAEALEYILDEHAATVPNNQIIERNSQNGRSAEDMALFISRHRSRFTQQEVDEYFRHMAIFELIEAERQRLNIKIDTNMNDTTPITYNIQGDFVQGDKHVYPEATTVTHNHFGTAARPAGVDPDEPLSYYITDADLLARIIDLAEHQCAKPQHVKTLIFDELAKAGVRRDILLSKPFIEALIPHLPQLTHPSVENLQKAFRNNA